LREDTNLSDEDSAQKFREAREAFNKKMKDILTADQYDKFEKMAPPGGKKGGKKKRRQLIVWAFDFTRDGASRPSFI